MKIAYYVTAMTDFQDMAPVIVESEKRSIDYRVFLIDCLEKKRQFASVDMEKLKKRLVQYVLVNTQKSENEISKKILSFGIDHQTLFNREYSNFNPDIIVVQNIHHKYPKWIPTAGKSRVVLFSMHHDAASHGEKSSYDVNLNVVRRKEEIEYFSKRPPEWFEKTLSSNLIEKNSKIESIYLGNVRAESCLHTPVVDKELERIPEKSCLILSTQVRGNDNYKSVLNASNRLLTKLKTLGYKTYWKARLKGYPETEIPFLRDLSTLPDVIIGEDYNMPSSISYLSSRCHACFSIQTSTAYWDLQKINERSCIVIPHPAGDREPRLIERYYKYGDSEIKTMTMISAGSHDFDSKIEEVLSRQRSDKYVKDSEGSSFRILNKMENIL